MGATIYSFLYRYVCDLFMISDIEGSILSATAMLTLRERGIEINLGMAHATNKNNGVFY